MNKFKHLDFDKDLYYIPKDYNPEINYLVNGYNLDNNITQILYHNSTIKQVVQPNELSNIDKKDMYCCQGCGSFNVSAKAWVDYNTNLIEAYCDEEPYCDDCGDFSEVIEYNEFLNNN